VLRRALLLAAMTAAIVVPLGPPAMGHGGNAGPCSPECEVDRARSALVPLSSPADSHRGDAGECSPECQADVDRARSVTAKYRDEKVALADGFLPAGNCESEGGPDGAMGIHYLNGLRYFPQHQPRVDEPEVLLYIPDLMGNRRLAAVEYAVPVLQDGVPYYGIDAPDPARIDPPPVLFGHPFDGPMPGHIAAQSWHYDLHVWAWSPNPRGTFAQYNPREACPPEMPAGGAGESPLAFVVDRLNAL
jgi:hypothetical protein